MTTNTDFRPNTPMFWVQFQLEFSVQPENEDSGPVKTEALIRKRLLDSDQPGWSTREVASVLLDRLAVRLGSPKRLSNFNRITATVEERMDAQGRQEPLRPPFSRRVLKRHEDGWMVRCALPVESGDANLGSREADLR